MSEQTHKVLTSSKEPNWRTPRKLVLSLDKEFDFHFDAAASKDDRVVPIHLGPGSEYGEDSLVVDWQKFISGHRGKAIFCNPPYSQGKPIDPWMEKMAWAGIQGPAPVVGIIPYSPQTKWWRKFVMGMDITLGNWTDIDKFPVTRATEVRLFPYRLKFDPPEGHTGSVSGANVNTAIVIWKSTKGFIEPWTPQVRYWDYKN